MSINEITLTSTMLADLYPDVLLEQSGQKRQRQPLNYLGGNEKNILIITLEHEAVYLADKQLNFLTSILDACKLGLKDVAIVNWMNLDQETKQELTKELSSHVVLLFGIEPGDYGLPVHFPPFQVQEFDKITYLHGPSLDEMEMNVSLKKQLWASLKRLFGI